MTRMQFGIIKNPRRLHGQAWAPEPVSGNEVVATSGIYDLSDDEAAQVVDLVLAIQAGTSDEAWETVSSPHVGMAAIDLASTIVANTPPDGAHFGVTVRKFAG